MLSAKQTVKPRVSHGYKPTTGQSNKALSRYKSAHICCCHALRAHPVSCVPPLLNLSISHLQNRSWHRGNIHSFKYTPKQIIQTASPLLLFLAPHLALRGGSLSPSLSSILYSRYQLEAEAVAHLFNIMNVFPEDASLEGSEIETFKLVS